MRKKISFMGQWEFARLTSPCREPGEAVPGGEWERVVLPHVWNKDRPAQEGCCLYRKTWKLEEDPAKAGTEACYFLEFDAVGGVARVFLNGIFLGEHRGGYSRFCLDAGGAIQVGENVLEVLADNTRYDNINPLLGDFSNFGGIYRYVGLLQTHPLHFDPTYYGTSGLDLEAGGDGSLKLVARIVDQNQISANSTTFLEYLVKDMEGKKVAGKQVAANEKETLLHVADPILWDGQRNPYLYQVEAVLYHEGIACDRIELNFGFREIKMTAREGFSLNGQRLRLSGVAKHQDFEGLGCGVGREQMEADFALIGEIGANAVRLSHYQHDAYAYDICDRQGLVTWAEIPMLAMPDGNDGIVDNAKDQLRELILQNKHHPSICFWGVQNEIAMGGESLETYGKVRELDALVKDLDPGRISAGANLYSVKNESPLNFINDAVGYNVYFGWYYGQTGEYRDFLRKFHEDNPDVALGITEYGVDCNLSFHSHKPERKDYTEEYQCVFHEEAYAAIEEDDRLWGSFVWNMFDFDSAIRDEGGIKGRNCKGLVTYDRQTKKDSFYFYKAAWSKEPFVHLTGRRYEKRCGQTTTIKVYSNQTKITLLVNGKEWETRQGSRVFVFENVPLKEETILEARAGEWSDTMTLIQVARPEAFYEYEKKGAGEEVSNWFTQKKEEEDLFPEGVYSLSDTIGDLLKNQETEAIVVEYLPEIAADKRARTFGGMSLLRILDRSGGRYSEETLKACNRALNRVRKQTKKRPHIIIFNPDEMRADTMGHLGNPAAITPWLDQFARTEGVSFSNAYCQNPVCVPSRCSFFTGLYPHVNGHRTMSHMLRPGENSFFKEMRQAGYHVWMNDRNDLYAGQYPGWLEEHADEVFCAGKKVRQAKAPDAEKYEGEGSPYYYSHMRGKLEPVSEAGCYSADEETVDEARRRILEWKEGDKPLCMFLGLLYPHVPYEVEEPYYSAIDRKALPPRIPYEECRGKSRMMELYRGYQKLGDTGEEEWDEIRAVYQGMCMKVDHMFRNLCDTLKEAGIYDDCAIFFFSDHGDFAGDYDMAEKAQNCFEDCLTKVPFLIKPPKGYRVDRGISESLVELVDFYATALAYAGVESSHTHFGKDLTPVVENRSSEIRSYAFCEGGRLPGETWCDEYHQEGGRTVEPSDVYWPKKMAQTDDEAHAKAIMIRGKRYKYISRSAGGDELYDLVEDPGERVNRIDDPGLEADRVSLQIALMKWLQATSDIVPKGYDRRFTDEMLWNKVSGLVPAGYEEEVRSRIRGGIGIGPLFGYCKKLAMEAAAKEKE